jgi:hypothetical protein
MPYKDLQVQSFAGQRPVVGKGIFANKSMLSGPPASFSPWRVGAIIIMISLIY